MRAALVRRDGTIGEVLRVPTVRLRGAGEIVDDLVSLISRLGSADAGGLPSVGIGVPTTFDERGRLDPSPNLPTMTGYPLRSALEDRLQRRVAVENDASCFALGEWRFGAGRGATVLVGITLGTGIGVGIVAGGQLLRGAHGEAGEICRSPVNLEDFEHPFRNVEDCVCGTALQNAYASATGTRLGGVRIAALAEQGDPAARAAFEVMGKILANTVLWIADLLDPDVIVLGGSVSASLPFFAAAMGTIFRDRQINLVRSELGDRAALYGAAMAAFSGLETEGEI